MQQQILNKLSCLFKNGTGLRSREHTSLTTEIQRKLKENTKITENLFYFYYLTRQQLNKTISVNERDFFPRVKFCQVLS